MFIDLDQLQIDIETNKPDLFVIAESISGGDYKIETYKDGLLYFRHYSFEPDFKDQIFKLYNVRIK